MALRHGVPGFRRLGRLLSAAALGLLAGCGLFGGGEPEPEPPVCERIDLPARALGGVMLRRPEGGAAIELLPLEGHATKGGLVRRIETEERMLRVRAREADGSFAGWFGERGTPIPGIADGAASAVRQLSFREEGVRFSGQAVYGQPTRGTMLPTLGQARYEGVVRIEGSDGAVFSGSVTVTVGFGSGRAEAAFSGLMIEQKEPASASPAPAPAVAAAALSALTEAGQAALDEAAGAASEAVGEVAGEIGAPLVEAFVADATGALEGDGVAEAAAVEPGPIASLGWKRLGLCGARIGSTGQGTFAAADAAGQRLPLAGRALFDATLYGSDEATGLPAEIGGVLMIQGDEGGLSGVFLARRAG